VTSPLNNNAPPLIIHQEQGGYRHSVEPFLLADFAAVRDTMRVLDIGTGVGIIPLLLSWRQPGLRITAIEIQKSLADMARRNVVANGKEGFIEIVHADFSSAIPQLDGTYFDLIVSNPPYRKLNSGRINPHPGKAVARHELALNLETLTAKGSALLPPGGKMVLAYPPNRFREVCRELERNGVRPSRVRFVYGHSRVAAKIFLLEAVKGKAQELREEPPLYVYNPDGSYTEEMSSIYVAFDYSGRSHRHR
jgi:tRNA1Val (adenine37-N6)-methyltransferase